MPYYPVSAQFEAALLASHAPVVKADAYLGGSLVRAGIPIESGEVTVDRGSKVRRSLQLTVADPSLLPWTATDPLGVYGQQLVVQAGIDYQNGTTEWVPLGTFTIDEPTGDTDGLGDFTLTGSSSEYLIQEAPFTTAATTQGYTDCVAAITALIRAVLPGATVVNLTGDGRSPSIATQTWDVGADRWDAVCQIAAAMSAEIGCDAQDRFVITDIPNPGAATSWDWDITYGGVLLADTREMSRQNVYTAVLVMGENTSDDTAPVSYLATDTGSSSPTRYGGPLGTKTKVISSTLTTTVGACQALAVASLPDATASNITATVDVIPNPALDAGVIVRLVHGNGTSELAAVQTATYPLDLSTAATVTMRGNHTDDTGS